MRRKIRRPPIDHQREFVRVIIGDDKAAEHEKQAHSKIGKTHKPRRRVAEGNAERVRDEYAVGRASAQSGQRSNGLHQKVPPVLREYLWDAGESNPEMSTTLSERARREQWLLQEERFSESERD